MLLKEMILKIPNQPIKEISNDHNNLEKPVH